MSLTARVIGTLLLTSIFVSAPVAADIQISHSPVTTASSGNRILLKSTVRNAKGDIVDVRAYFKAADDTRFYYVPMLGNDAQYSGVLPAPALGVGAVEYMIYAVGSDKVFVKTPRWTIEIKDDEEALERMSAKEPVDIEIDLDRVEKLREHARSDGEPDINQRVDVRTEIASGPQPTQIPGFSDYIALGGGTPAAAGAGIAAATTVSVSSGAAVAGLSTTAIIGGVAAAGAVALASGGGSGSSSPFSDDPTNLVGSWSGNATNWTITSDNGSVWTGTSSPGGCGDLLTISGTRSGSNIAADFFNNQGGGSLTGSLSGDGNTINLTFAYDRGICIGESGSLTLSRL